MGSATVTPSTLIRALAALIEEVAHKGFDEHGDEQPITVDQWNRLNERWEMIFLMNKSRAPQEQKINLEANWP